MENIQKRYWLRGALTVILIWAIFSVLMTLISDQKSLWVAILTNDNSFYGSLDEAVTFFPGSWIIGEVVSYNFSTALLRFEIITVNIIFYALLGSFIGWLYGKIRDRKSLTPNS